jgi:hypothetical protein
VRFFNGFSNIPDVYLPYKPDSVIKTELPTDSRRYDVGDEYTLYCGPYDTRNYLMDSDGNLYEIFREDDDLYLSGVFGNIAYRWLGKWD